MIAVLIDSAGTRLGHTQVSEHCNLIKHRGHHFVKTTEHAALPGTGTGVVFAGAEIHVYDILDVKQSTRNFSKWEGEKR